MHGWLEKILAIMDAMWPEEQFQVLNWGHDGRVWKLVFVIDQLPHEEREVIFNRYNECSAPSERVVKLFELVQSLSPAEKDEFLKMIYNDNVKPKCDLCSKEE